MREERIDTIEVVIPVRRHAPGSGTYLSNSEVEQEAEKLLRAARVPEGCFQARLRKEVTSYCGFCGRPWTRRLTSPHNGGCCPEDAKNLPRSGRQRSPKFGTRPALDEPTALAIREALWSYIPGPLGAAMLVVLYAPDPLGVIMDYTHGDVQQLVQKGPLLLQKANGLEMHRGWLHLREFFTKRNDGRQACRVIRHLLHTACNKAKVPYYEPGDFSRLVQAQRRRRT